MKSARKAVACDLCGTPMELMQTMRLKRHGPPLAASYRATCLCWLCPCSERFSSALNLAGKPCSICGHEQGACDCTECPGRCGFLHPSGYICDREPLLLDDDVPF